MTTLAMAEPLSFARRVGVGLGACAFVAAIGWQVATQRDDWPLSCFKMYSGIEGPVTSRSFVRGVSEQGEFELADDVIPVGGAQLRHLNAKLARNKVRQRAFARAIQRRYEAARAREGWPVLQAIRSYTETWKIRGGLEGIDHPKRKLVGSMYVPTSALLDRLRDERAGRASVAEPRSAPKGDVVVDVDPAACAHDCAGFADRYASQGNALRLSAGDDEASVSVSVQLPPGQWSLFVRLRTPKARGSDRLAAELDGHRISGKSGLGNYEDALGRGAWVWASEAPGEPALTFGVSGRSAHVLRFGALSGAIELDQVWLSRTQHELPIWNEPVVP